jgi:glyoxylase-like metal-dependent hydrolase (beta-lactamase superfamily II)
MIEVEGLTVGPFQENCWIARQAGAGEAIVVDPGDEPERLLAAVERLGVRVAGILITHCHVDHVGAVAPVARATGAEVWCPALEVDMLRDIMAYVPWADLGPYEGYEPEHTLAGGERLALAGFDIDVLHTPGHSPGHVTFHLAEEGVVFSGDVLFQSSIGRTDLPGGDTATLMRTLASLVDALPEETVVHPGHMGRTTIGREAESNPFLAQLAQYR